MSPVRRPRSAFPWAPVLVVAFVIVGASVTAWLMGALEPLGLRAPGHAPETRKPAHVAGMTPVPISPRAIPAYTKLTRDDLIDAKSGTYAFIDLPPAQVTPDMITSRGDVIGRVLAKAKPAGYVFTEADFLPKGTRPGLEAGIPAGLRAVRVQAEKLKGVFGLQPGDRVDVVSTLKIDAAANAAPAVSGPYSWQIAAAAKSASARPHAAVTTVVSGGVVVTAVETRQIPTTSSSLTQGVTTRTQPVQEIVIAVRPEEVGPLMEALTVGADLTCLPRSGRPDDPADARTPDLPAPTPFGDLASSRRPLDLVEQIEGQKREIVPVPRAAEPAGDKAKESR